MNRDESAGTALLVDDDAASAVTAAMELHKHGFRTIRAESGQAAVEVLFCGARIHVVLIRAEAVGVSVALRTAGEIRRYGELPIVFYAPHSRSASAGGTGRREPDVRITVGEPAPELLAAVKSVMHSPHPVMRATPLHLDCAQVVERVDASRRLLERSVELLRAASYSPSIRVPSARASIGAAATSAARRPMSS